MKKTFVASVLSLMLSVGGAGAADSTVSWSGFYAGIHAGGIQMRNNLSETINVGDSTVIKDRSGIYGALVGYNWRYGNFVSGFELDFGVSNVRGYDDFFDIRSGVDWVSNGRLRAGFIVDRTLFFVAGGISFARVQQTAFPNVFQLDKQHYYTYGVTIGAGIETYVTQSWLFRAEYLYTNYTPFDQTYTPVVHAPTDIDTHIARVALIYQFGGGAKPQPARTYGPANWSGAYVGAHAGQTGMKESHTIFFPFAVDGSTRDRGFFGGALAGINLQLGQWVTGFEVDFGSGRLSGFEDTNFIGLPFDSKMLWDAHIRARLGYTYGNYLLHVSGGMALAQFRQLIPFNDASTRLFTGYTYGLGVDTLIAPNFIFRIEYLVSRYLDNTANFAVDVNLKTETLRAAIIYKYDSANASMPTPPRGSYNWSGAYLGLYAGRHELTQTFSSFGDVDNFKMQGFNGGLLAGFNRQEGNWVWGFEVNGGLFDSKSVTRLSACLCDEVTIKGIAENHWRLRLGYAMGQYLPFITVGVAFGKFQQSPSLDSPKSRIHTGFTAGAGIDTILASNWLLRLEYLLTDYDQRFYNYTDTGGDATDTKNKTHTVRAAIIYKLDQ